MNKNMKNRLEEIKGASNEWFNSFRCGKSCRMGFEVGAMWADDNPKSPWVSVKDDLPCKHKELVESNPLTHKQSTKFVLVIDSNGCVQLTFMEWTGHIWIWNRWEVLYWMPIPQLPEIVSKSHSESRKVESIGGIKSTKKDIKFYNSSTGDTFLRECEVVFEGKGNFDEIIIVRYGDKFQDYYFDECENAFVALTDINKGIEPWEVWADLDSDPFGTTIPILECPRWFNLSTLCEDLD